MAYNESIRELMNAAPHEALTFDDVTLVTQYADFLPSEADPSSRLTRHVRLNVPFVSAAMDTVTEAEMAIAMAMMGGIGIVHKNVSAEEQAAMVGRVKHYLNGLIADPITFRADQTLAEVRETRKQRGYAFSGFPILDGDGILVGILTSRDIKFADSPDARIAEAMTAKVVTAPPGTDLKAAYLLMRKHRIGKLPLVRDGRLVGLYSYADVSELIEDINPMYNRDDQYALRVGAAIGPGDQERAEWLIGRRVDVLVIDTAHGHSRGVIDMLKWLKSNHPGTDVIAGNIATAEAARDLLKAGADAVKVGIGPGSICTTRVVAGVGIPQITAIYRCAEALQDEIPVIADGGVRHSGDIPKALVAGAESVMMGSVLAGTDESPGEKILYEGRQYVVYRGMGSLDAMRSREGSRERYGQADTDRDDLVPQGIEGIVPYAGSVQKVVKQHLGGLCASMGYCGCRRVEELRKKGRFMRISLAGVREAHPHDVKITKEAPNYRS
jgi:IMP dehydrogenase